MGCFAVSGLFEMKVTLTCQLAFSLASLAAFPGGMVSLEGNKPDAMATVKEYTILCFGDSITAAGYWIERLENDSPHRFINGGQSGRRAAHAPEELGEVLDDHPEADALILMLGVNDLPARDPRPGEVKVAKVVADMGEAIERARRQIDPANILLVAPPTVYPERLSDVNLQKGYQVTPSLLAQLEAGYRALAREKVRSWNGA
ncbi:MAG: GDSL-type esterase/lipase family protein [Oceanipulchritudo sp.]